MTKNKVSYFTGGFADSNYSIENNEITKKALILVEGTHTDSKKRKHTFTPERLENIVNNTNALFDDGANIPILADHNKSVFSTLGSLESNVYTAVITKDNLPNPKATNLIGKVGIFADEIVVKAKDAVEKVSRNIVKTISAGLDVATDTIREISLTPTPAIQNMSLYKSANFDSSAMTFDDLDSQGEDENNLKEEYIELTMNLWTLINNIFNASEEELQGIDSQQLIGQALSDFGDRLFELIGVSEEDEAQEDYEDPRLMQSQGFNPNMNMGMRQAMMPQMPRNSRYSRGNSIPIAAFSMADMERINAEFGIFDGIKQTGSKILGGIKSDTSKIGKAFTTGRKIGLSRGAMSLKTKAPTIGTQIKSSLSGIGRASKRALNTNTGKVTAGVLGTGAAIGGGIAGYKALTRKNKQNNY